MVEEPRRSPRKNEGKDGKTGNGGAGERQESPSAKAWRDSFEAGLPEGVSRADLTCLAEGCLADHWKRSSPGKDGTSARGKVCNKVSLNLSAGYD